MHISTWMDLKGIMLSKKANLKRSDTVWPHYRTFSKWEIIELENTLVCQGQGSRVKGVGGTTKRQQEGDLCCDAAILYLGCDGGYRNRRTW